MSSQEFYGAGYDDSDKRIPDMTIINKQLGMIFFFLLYFYLLKPRVLEAVWQKSMGFPGWDPKTSLWDLLESTLTYQHRTYAEAMKQAIAKPTAN